MNNHDINGSNDKPYPQEGNFVRNDDPDERNVVRSREEMTRPNMSIGQAKYAVRGMGPSIYEDRTRNTADDDAACKVADSGKPALDNYEDGKY